MCKNIIISTEKHFPDEVQLIREMLDLNSQWRFHLRKPEWSLQECKGFLQEIGKEYHASISLHQHLELTNEYPLVSRHLKEKNRMNSLGRSTSFHTKKDVIAHFNSFEYFFCSPVFLSISKEGHSSDENWNMNDCSKDIKQKAVALSGMSEENIPLAIEKGFENFAFLGSIWFAENPFKSFMKIDEICQKSVPTV